MMFFSSNPDRSEILEKITGSVIDIGGGVKSLVCTPYAVVDLFPNKRSALNFIGNINLPEVWAKVHKNVKENGKFDFAICTHTLEDISNPLYVCREIEKIAHRGLIIVPSKFKEMARFGNHYRGFIHHRWIFDIVDGVFTGFPKINYIEHPKFDSLASEDNSELVYFWEGKIDLQIINGDFLGPDNASVESYYDRLL